jgi:hypothetical protein
MNSENIKKVTNQAIAGIRLTSADGHQGRDWFTCCVTFSSMVIRWTRSSARCCPDKAAFEYADASDFWAHNLITVNKNDDHNKNSESGCSHMSSRKNISRLAQML